MQEVTRRRMWRWRRSLRMRQHSLLPLAQGWKFTWHPLSWRDFGNYYTSWRICQLTRNVFHQASEMLQHCSVTYGYKHKRHVAIVIIFFKAQAHWFFFSLLPQQKLLEEHGNDNAKLSYTGKPIVKWPKRVSYILVPWPLYLQHIPGSGSINVSSSVCSPRGISRRHLCLCCTARVLLVQLPCCRRFLGPWSRLPPSQLWDADACAANAARPVCALSVATATTVGTWGSLEDPADSRRAVFSDSVLQWVSVFGRARLGQNVRLGNLTLIQGIPYTHNKWTTLFFVWPSHKKKV